MKWEYDVRDADLPLTSYELTVFSIEEGWELVQIILFPPTPEFPKPVYAHYLKRPLVDSANDHGHGCG